MFPFLRPNLLQIPNANKCLYPLFSKIRQKVPLTQKEWASINERALLTLKGSSTYLAIKGDWPEKYPGIYNLLISLMEGHVIVVKEDFFEKLIQEQSLNEAAKDYFNLTVKPWGALEGAEILPNGIRFAGKHANRFGSVAATVSGRFLQPTLAVYETVKEVKKLMDFDNQKNWVVVTKENCAALVNLIWKIKSRSEETEKSFSESMAVTLMGPEEFWKRWYLKNKGTRQTFFWESKEQVRQQQLREQFMQDLVQSKKKPVGWVSEAHLEISHIFNTGLPADTALSEKESALLTEENNIFLERVFYAYRLGYSAFVEKDEESERNLVECWGKILSEQMGVCNPKLVLHHVGVKQKECEEVYERYVQERNGLLKKAVANAGMTALFFMWDYPFSPLIALPLRLATYGLPDILFG